MKKTHLTIHQSGICFCPVVRSEGIPGMWSVVLRSAGSSHLFSLAQQHNAVHPLNELTPWDGCVKPMETLRVCGVLLWLITVRWDQTVCTANRVEKKYSSWGILLLVGILGCLFSLFIVRFFILIFNKVTSDDSQHTHIEVLPSIF